MPISLSHFGFASEEIFLLCSICVVLLVDLFLSDRNRVITYALSILALTGAAVITVIGAVDADTIVLGGHYQADRLGDILKLCTYLVVAVVFLYSRDYLQRNELFKGEYYLLGLFATLGIMTMISANSLLTIYMGLECMSLSLYALVAFDRNSPVAAESAMKYFVLGAIASGTLLFGMSYLYGATGTLEFGQLAIALDPNTAGADPTDIQIVFALAFIVVGIAFKFGAVPFHMWLPDVYQGARTPVTLFIGSAPKIAAFAMAIRILAEGMGNTSGDWQDMLIVLSVLSMGIGNLVAIVQTNIKRMLAYSAISHVGFILLGLMAGGSDGYQAAMFYTIVYVLMATAAFGMVILLSRRGFEAELLDDFKGLNARSPWFAGMMMIVMFSMAGVPPFLGFYAKVAVIGAALGAGFPVLAVLAVVFSVIGAFYYLRIVKLMYFDAADDTAPIEASADMRIVLSINSLAILALGLFPGALIQLCASAF